MKRLGLIILLWAQAGLAYAGFVELYNGDRVEGDFVKLDGDALVWRSNNFGKLTIARSKIKNLSTTMPMKLSGSTTPCLIDGMKYEYLFYTCGGDPEQRRVPLASLEVMLPFESHIEGDYTYRGKLSVSGFFAEGNDVRQDIKTKTHIEYRRSEFRHNVNLEYASYSSDNKAPDDLWLGRYTLDWFFRERWFSSSDASVGADESRGVERYYALGTGTGYQFWESSDLALSTTAGLTYLNEEYEIPEQPEPGFDSQNERFALRLGTNFRYLLPLGVSFFHESEITRSLEDSGDWRLTTGTGVSTLLAGTLYSEVKIDYNVDNQPQPDKQREDTRLMVGVSYEW